MGGILIKIKEKMSSNTSFMNFIFRKPNRLVPLIFRHFLVYGTINLKSPRFKYINPLNLPMIKTSTLVSTSLKTTKNKQHVEIHVDDIEPSDSLIQNILNYSKSLTIQKSKSVGFIEVVAS